MLTEEDFAKARVEGTDSVTIQDFVPGEAIEEARRAEGHGTIVLRQREYLAAVEPAGEALILITMRFAHEIRSLKHLDLPSVASGWDKREMDLALRLIDTLAGEWRPEKYKDTYRDVLMQVIEQKAKGREIAAPRRLAAEEGSAISRSRRRRP